MPWSGSAAPDCAPEEAAAERAIRAATLRMRIHAPFFGALLLFAQARQNHKIATAATDGVSIFYNPAYVASLFPSEVLGLLLHEVLHAALEHPARRGSRDALRWNVAADIVTNGIVAKCAWASLPVGAIRDTRFEDLTVEEVYERIVGVGLAESMRDLLEPSSTDTDGRPLDVASYWSLARAQAGVASTEHGYGTMAAGLSREIDTLTNASVDWRSVLWRFVVRTPDDYGAFDRRHIHRGLYLEALESESVTVYVCVDTSGSIQADHLTAFMSEVRAMLRTYPHVRGVLYYADTELDGPFAIDRPLPKPRGGGGTSFVPFFDAIDRERSVDNMVAVYLTDGEGLFPSRRPRVPVLWAVTPGGVRENHFPFGEVLRLRSIRAHR